MKSHSLKAFPIVMAIGVGVVLGAATVSAATAPMPGQAMPMPMLAKEHAGKIVYTQSGNEIGKVKDMVHAASGPEAYAVITLGGGTLDTPLREVTVPAGEISFVKESVTLTRGATKDLVTSMPIYKTNTATRVTQ